MKANNVILKGIITVIIFYFGMMSGCFADIYINVVAVNGKDVPKTSSIHYDLPGELTAEDILDTNGLSLDYSVDDGNYYVYGDVTLNAKESKTFRIHIKDKWMVSQDEVADLKKQIDQGYTSLGVPYNPQNADILKGRLYSKIDYIVNLQSSNGDSTDKRIDSFRAYAKEMKRIRDSSLDVSYWRSDPSVVETPKLIHLSIDVHNPTLVTKSFKHKDYLPAEVKPEDVVEAEGFEVRYDQAKQLSFLFKEEDLTAGQDKKYSIGIVDIWNIDQKDIDYLLTRAKNTYDLLSDCKFEPDAKILLDRITAELNEIETSQAIQRPVPEHISAFRANKITYNDAEKDVETLEKLLSIYREDLTKSKVQNILTTIKQLKGVADVSKVMFNKKFEESSAWSFIAWILMFVGIITLVNFLVWIIRSKDKKIKDEKPKEDKPKDDKPAEEAPKK